MAAGWPKSSSCLASWPMAKARMPRCRRGPGTLVVVTHALTVQALVGVMPGQAETVVVRPTLGKEPGVEAEGRIPVPE